MKIKVLFLVTKKLQDFFAGERRYSQRGTSVQFTGVPALRNALISVEFLEKPVELYSHRLPSELLCVTCFHWSFLSVKLRIFIKKYKTKRTEMINHLMSKKKRRRMEILVSQVVCHV